MLRLLAICLLVATTPAFAAENLVTNPSFESGDNRPDGWSFNHRRTDGVIAWDDSRASSGEHSVVLANEEGQTGNVVQTVQIDPPLPPGSRVTYGAMSATEDAGRAPQIIMYCQPPGGARQTVSTSGTPGTHDFVEVSATDVTDRSVASFVIYLCHYGTGTAWWDDAYLSVERGRETSVLDRPPADGASMTLSTSDGLSLTLSNTGGVASVSVDGPELKADGMRSGLWLEPIGEDTVPVVGELEETDRGLTQRWESEDLGLRVAAQWSSGESAITCLGEVVDVTGEPRCVDITVAIPVGAQGEGWRWGRSVVEAVPVWEAAEDGEAQAVPQGLSDHTFSALSREDAALSLAVPADSPCVCRFGWSQEFGLTITYEFGLSPDASGDLKGRAPFAFTISRIDPQWGMRDAARRYQERNPAAFEKHVEREGLWMFGRPRIDLPDPEYYTFHEGGPNGREYDDEHGISTCPYIIPGQREITRLEKLPGSPAEALELFRNWQPQDDRRRGRGWGNRAIIENCMLHDAEGDPVVEIRNTSWGGNSITFPLNANPWLFEGTADRETIAGKLLEHVAAQHDEYPNLDGTYVDSLGHWGDFDNFRREHFAAERVPLTRDISSGRPIINNRFTLLEFLWELRDLLHERGKLLFANGVHPDRRFHFFALDVLGVEGRNRLHQKRTMAGTKPFLLLIYRIHENPEKMRYWFNRCTQWGIYPSFGNMRLFDTPEKYAPIAALNQRFVPALRTITSAGWHPITHAQAPDGVLVERWGPNEGGDVYLTVFSEEATDAQVRIDAEALGFEGPPTARDLLSDDEFTCQAHDDAVILDVPLDAARVRVLKLSAE